MKTKNMKDNGVQKSALGRGNDQDKQEGEDTEEDEDEDEDHDEPVVVNTSVADTCSAAHEFEWLSPNSQQGGMTYSHLEKPGERVSFSEASADGLREEQGPASCQVSPARSHYRHYKPSIPFWPRRPADQADQIRMSPSPCHELHNCHRHASPMRSSWCCPSPPPHALCLHHHGGSVISGLELVPYNRDCYGGTDIACWPSYQGCACLPPTGLPPPPRYHESHGWCRNPSPQHSTEIIRRESSSPCSTAHRPCQGSAGANGGASRRSRSTTSRKRDCSPTALSPRYSPIPHNEQIPFRHSGHEQWQIPVQTDEMNNQQKIQQLEADKKNLILQASVLADQVEAQSDKINELERLLVHKKEQFNHLEQSLHQEMLARTSVENNKLEIMTELSNLRLRLTAAERDRKDSDERCRKLENDLVLMHARLSEKEAEYSALRNKVMRNGTVVSSSDKNSELEKLRLALDSVMVSNDEKDRKIDDLRLSLTKYKKLQDFVLSSHTRKTSDTSVKDIQVCEDSSLPTFTNDIIKDLQNEGNLMKPPQVPRSQLPSTSNSSKLDMTIVSAKENSGQSQYSPTSVRSSPATTFKTCTSFQKSNSVENMCPLSKAGSVTNQYGTVPRQNGSQVLQQLQEKLQQHEATDTSPVPIQGSSVVDGAFFRVHTPGNNTQPAHSGDNVQKFRSKSSGVSFGKGFFKLRSGKRSSSAPELAPQECVSIPIDENGSSTLPPASHHYLIKGDKNKGFFKIFSKWKRSGSQNIEKLEGDFKRGGVRSTAGPRLGWSREVSRDPDIPFNNWNTDLIVDWLNKMGLSMYISECKRWLCNGETLQKASPQELEKELNLKNPLHKKKLILAIKSMSSKSPNLPSSLNSLDYQWVVRWLDDVGLPQYKDSFADARVDGRVLHCLTVEDLLYLKVVSQLHHVSIKCSIQVLREKNFDPHCLIRRSLPDESKAYEPELVALWSNHRVMEWLRTVDLSEYAPNLRGSGVHGALIVYEAKFNTDLFATLLNIPPTKTLLRRHLATHFKNIVGSDLMQLKRENQADVPLSPSVKIKVTRKNQFALKKKRNKMDYENEEYICPMDVPMVTDAPKSSEGDKLVVRRNSDPSPQDQRHLQNLLQGETLLNEAPTTVV